MLLLSNPKDIADLHGKLIYLKSKDETYIGKLDVIDSAKVKITGKFDNIISIGDITESRQIKWIRKV